MKATKLFGVAVALLLVSAACTPDKGVGAPSSTNAASSATATVAASTDPITIGLLTPLSPPGDPAAGQLIQRGAELGVVYVNTIMKGVLNGRQVQLAVEDDAGTPATGATGYRRLVTEKKAVAVTGQFHSSVNIAVNEVANEVGVPVISTQGSAADITAKRYSAAFRTHVIDPFRASSWLSWIQQKGYKKIALIAETSDYGVGLVNETKAQAAAGNMNLTFDIEQFDHASTDLTPQLLKAKAFGPDLVINIGVGAPADLMLDQANTIGLYPAVPMLISYDTPTRAQWFQLHPSDGVGVYFIAYFSPKEELSEAGQWLATAYQAKYNEPPIYGALNAFADVIVIAQAIQKAGKTDAKTLITTLEDPAGYKGWATVPVTFPKDGAGAFYHTWIPPILILQYTQANQNWRDAKLDASFSKK